MLAQDIAKSDNNAAMAVFSCLAVICQCTPLLLDWEQSRDSHLTLMACQELYTSPLTRTLSLQGRGKLCYHRIRAVAQVSPPPIVARQTRSPVCTLPARTAASSVSGSDEEEVFPYHSIRLNVRDDSIPSLFLTVSSKRPLA